MTGSPGPPGTQPERTRLAWARTALATTGVTLLAGTVVLRTGVHPVRAAALVAITFVWLAAVLLTRRRVNVLRRGAPAIGSPPVVALPVAGLALLVTGLALLSAVLVIR